MLSPGNNKLLIVSEQQFEKVRESYNVTRESIDKDIDTLINWCATQAHLPQIELDRGWIERVFIMNKCSVERTQRKLEMTFVSRNAYPEYFMNRNPADSYKFGKLSLIGVPLPKLSSDNTRILLCKYFSTDTEYFSLREILKNLFMTNEYRQYHDYCIGDQYIHDLRGQTFGHILKIYPSECRKADFVNRNVYGNRIASIHILCNNLTVKYIITLLKFVLPAKLGKRINVHQTVESLHEFIPKEILPKDYGGDEKPLSEIVDDWEAEMCSEKQVNWFKQNEEIRSDDSKRKL